MTWWQFLTQFRGIIVLLFVAKLDIMPHARAACHSVGILSHLVTFGVYTYVHLFPISFISVCSPVYTHYVYTYISAYWNGNIFKHKAPCIHKFLKACFRRPARVLACMFRYSRINSVLKHALMWLHMHTPSCSTLHRGQWSLSCTYHWKNGLGAALKCAVSFQQVWLQRSSRLWAVRPSSGKASRPYVSSWPFVTSCTHVFCADVRNRLGWWMMHGLHSIKVQSSQSTMCLCHSLNGRCCSGLKCEPS